MAKTKDTSHEIDIVTLKQGEATFYILGSTPFFCNRVSEKAKRELLMPRGRLTSAQKQTNLKHDPEAEYRASPYLRRGDGETRIMMPSTAFKKSLAQAAIDMPSSVARTQIGRLTYVVDEYVPIFGRPALHMGVVRSADVARTPDIRTRARIDRWATKLTVRWIMPHLNETKIATLLAAAGVVVGVGDYRQEKGSGSFGLYELVAQDDPRYLEVVQNGGTAVQDAALANPECADAESEELLVWYKAEVQRRGTEQAEPKAKGKRGRPANGEASIEVAH